MFYLAFAIPCLRHAGSAGCTETRVWSQYHIGSSEKIQNSSKISWQISPLSVKSSMYYFLATHTIEEDSMIYSTEVKNMCPVMQGVHHGAAPIPEEAKWVKAKKVEDISGYTHGVGWCAPQQGACKLSLNVKDGVIQEALVETLGCSGMTHSAAMAAEILPGLTILEALNTDLVCDAINTAMRELFLQIVYGRSQSAFSEDGLQIGAGLEDLGKGTRSMIGTTYGTLSKGPRYLELTDGYITKLALDENDEIIGYEYVNFGKMMDFIKKGDDAQKALEKASGKYGRVADAVRFIDPRHE